MRYSTIFLVAVVSWVAGGHPGAAQEKKGAFPLKLKFEQVQKGKVVYTADSVSATIVGKEARKWVLVGKEVTVAPMKGDRVTDGDGKVYTVKSSTAVSFGARYQLETIPPPPEMKSP